MSEHEHAYGDGCPDDSATHWRDLYEAMGREYTRVNTLYMREITGRSREQRAAEAAMRSRIWDNVFRNTDVYIRGGVVSEIGQLAWAFGQLDPDKATVNQLRLMRSAAYDLGRRIIEWRAEPGNPELVELRRIRDAVRTATQRLHERNELAANDDMCLCPGCELHRDVYATGADSDDDG